MLSGLNMLNSIKDYASSTFGTAFQRIKNPAFGALILSWCAFNWKQLLYLLFSNTSIFDRIEYITAISTWKTVIGYPIVSVIILCGFIPWVNYLIATWQIKPLDRTDSIDNQRKAKMIRRATRLQRLQAKHDVTYDKVRTGAEKDIQSMKEQITLSQDRMGELTAEISAKEEELKRYVVTLFDSKKQNDSLNETINQLTSDFNTLEEQHKSLINEYNNYKSRYAIASTGGEEESDKYLVNSYNISTKASSNGIERVYLDVTLTNYLGDRESGRYWFSADGRDTIQSIISALNQGFSYAHAHRAKITISENKERKYVFFELPSAKGKQRHQFTGAKN